MGADSKIIPKEDGPLVVTAPPEVRHQDGTPVDTPDVAALCRCGASKNKPFCDGAHAAIGFSSAPDTRALRNEPIAYEGEVEGRTATVSYTPVLCSHAGECQRIAPKAFAPETKPWIHPENASMAEILSVMAACPSGALRAGVDGQEPQHQTSDAVEIVIEQHGPYRVTNVELAAQFNGEGASRAKYVLCRCGRSKNKPFCDGTHHDVQWRDDA